jgi:hypothetical protein
VVREGVGAGGGEMTQALYAHMNNKKQTNKQKTKGWGSNSVVEALVLFPALKSKLVCFLS